MTEILTKRLKLRLIELSGLHSIHKLLSLPETDEFNALGIPNDIEHTKNIIEPWVVENKLNKIINYTFAIEIESGSEFIGLFGFKLGDKDYKRGEIWYKIHSDYWKKGYATESVKAAINFGFENLKLHRIVAGCAVDNIGSIKVLEKAGMIRDGRGKQILRLKSGWSDNFEYSILETDQRR